eukprot:IDg17779t1
MRRGSGLTLYSRSAHANKPTWPKMVGCCVVGGLRQEK